MKCNCCPIAPDSETCLDLHDITRIAGTAAHRADQHVFSYLLTAIFSAIQIEINHREYVRERA